MLALYLTSSTQRLEINPNDKLLPSFGQMSAAVERLAFTPDKRSGDYLFWQDTASSLKRLGSGLAIAAVAGLCLGVAAGTLPLRCAAVAPANRAVDGATAGDPADPVHRVRVGRAVQGDADRHRYHPDPRPRPRAACSRDTRELLIKAQTLGANTWTLILRLVLPQLLPRLLISLRLVLGSAWLFLIAAEAIASTDGLGYRIFLVRRYMAMDVILPYVAWITLLAWAMDFSLRRLAQLLFLV